MRSFKFLSAIVFVFAGLTVMGQQSPSPETNPSVQSEAASKSNTVRDVQKSVVKVGNVSLPPEKTHPVTIPKISPGITIDGKIDEATWKDAAVFKDFYQVAPGDNTAPSKPTEVYVMYDEKNLYVAFRCWDDRDKIRATIAKRDEVFGEDNVRMWLDTYDDQRRAYVIGFNPLGIQQDGIFTEGAQMGADFSVDIVMESKGVIEDWGWSVEAKIPFKSLRYSAGKGKMWGFNVARNIDRFNDEFDQWLPDDRNVSGQLIKNGKITGLDGIKYEHTLEISPSVTISETGQRKRTIANAGYPDPIGMFDPIFNPIGLQDPGRFVNDPVKYDLGLNLKYTLSPNVTLDATINPDYAEIEADAPVVTANQRFPIFFEEKRPFFLEGKEIFESSPLQPFYSRTIVDPDFAAKLSGKIGKTSFGFLGASDNAPGNFSEDDRGELNVCLNGRATDKELGLPLRDCGSIEELLGKNATFGVLRVKQDVGKENSLGFFASARTFPHNRNFVGGFDGKFKPNERTVVTFQVLGTHSRKNFYDPERDETRYRTGNGLAYYFSVDYTTDRHGWFVEAIGRSRDYRSDAGFTQRTDTNRFMFANRLSTKSNPDGFLIRLNSRQFFRYVLDWKGRLQEGVAGANAEMNLQGNMRIQGEAGLQFEKIYEDEFGPKRDLVSGRPGAFFGEPTRFSRQPYFSVNINKNFNEKFSMYGFVGSIFNAMDYDFGAAPQFPRASPAFRGYLASPQYNTYIQDLVLYQADPVNNPYPSVFPDPPQQDPGPGWQFDLQMGAEYKPISPLRLSLDYTKSRLRRNDNGEVAFDTNIFSFRSTYNFTRFTYVRTRLDYDTLQRHVGGQFLFGWSPNPGTAFYVGYNDSFNYNGFSPITGQFEPRFERNSRTFFIRASYLFRKSF